MSAADKLQPGTPVVLHNVYQSRNWDGETGVVAGDALFLNYVRIVLDNPRPGHGKTLLLLPNEFTVSDGKE